MKKRWFLHLTCCVVVLAVAVVCFLSFFLFSLNHFLWSKCRKIRRRRHNSNNNNWTIIILLLFICYCSCSIAFRVQCCLTTSFLSLSQQFLYDTMRVWVFLLLLYLLHKYQTEIYGNEKNISRKRRKSGEWSESRKWNEKNGGAPFEE